MEINSEAEEKRLRALFEMERRLWESGVKLIAGVDEAGRGPLAGPVVAAAVVFAAETLIPGLKDSKLLKAEQREAISIQICRCAAALSVGMASVEEIDRLNILRASLLAMKRAVEGLEIAPDYLLVDGKFSIPDLSHPQRALIKGDQLSASIAAASIIAKVYRDQLMRDYHGAYPAYGFDRHKGYPTAAHICAIQKFGRCEIHRQTFHIRGQVGVFEEGCGR